MLGVAPYDEEIGEEVADVFEDGQLRRLNELGPKRALYAASPDTHGTLEWLARTSSRWSSSRGQTGISGQQSN
jgi:hypothetical protein